MKRYIRFLNLKKALTKDFVDTELDFTSQRLLELVALSEHCDQRMTVTEAMNLNIASPATIHRKIDELLAKEYISLVYAGQNRRTKYLTLTKKSNAYFNELAKILVKSIA
jgi:DNA-binding MarR family transcriptional regulator